MASIRFVTIFFFLLLVTLRAPFQAWPQSSFTGSNGNVNRTSLDLYGGHAEDLEIASNGNLYIALNSPNGIFCSTDGGVNWSGPPAKSDFGNVAAVEVGETDNTIYIIGGIKLYKSANAGSTYSELTITGMPSNFGQAMAFAFNTLLVAYRDGTVSRSIDYGTTITNVTVHSSVATINDLAASPTTGTFYALATDTLNSVTIYRSTDWGATWTDVGTSFSGDSCTNLAVNPSDANEILATGLDTVMITTNGSTTWTDVSSNHDGSIKQDITFDGSRIFVGAKYSDDDGLTWANYNDGILSSDTQLLSFFTPHPLISTSLYMTSMRGFARSTDGGSIWLDAVSGVFGVVVNDIRQAADKDIVYLAVTAGIAKSTNFTYASGPTWNYPMPVTSGGDSPHAVFIVDPFNSNAALQTVLAAAAGGILRSTDGGTTWNQTTISPGLNNRDAVVDFAGLSFGGIVAVFANGDSYSGGMLVSTDDGVNWSHNSPVELPPGNDVATVAVYSALTGTVTMTNGSTAVTGSGTAFLTELTAGDVILLDDDSTSVPIPWAVVAIVTNDTALILEEGYNGAGGSDAASVVSGDTAVIGTGHENNATSTLRGIFTYDGSTWTDVSGTVDDKPINDVAVACSSSGNAVFAASGEGSQGSVYLSTDAGATWTDLGSYGLPSDGWFHSLAIDPDDTDIVFVATGRPAGSAVLWQTTDGGSSWNSYYTALTDEAPNVMLVDALTVGFDTGVFEFTTRNLSPSSSASSSSSGGSGCFVATAAFGSALEPRVDLLREFRDSCLLHDPLGRACVDLYYATSPPLADIIAGNESLRGVARALLIPVAELSRYPAGLGLTRLLPILGLLVLFTLFRKSVFRLTGTPRSWRRSFPYWMAVFFFAFCAGPVHGSMALLLFGGTFLLCSWARRGSHLRCG